MILFSKVLKRQTPIWRSIIQGESIKYSHTWFETHSKVNTGTHEYEEYLFAHWINYAAGTRPLSTQPQRYACRTALWTALHAAPTGTWPTGTFHAVTGYWLPTSLLPWSIWVTPSFPLCHHTILPDSPKFYNSTFSSCSLNFLPTGTNSNMITSPGDSSNLPH